MEKETLRSKFLGSLIGTGGECQPYGYQVQHLIPTSTKLENSEYIESLAEKLWLIKRDSQNGSSM